MQLLEMYWFYENVSPVHPPLTFNRLYVSVGIGKMCSYAQGAAIGAGFDAGGLE